MGALMRGRGGLGCWPSAASCRAAIVLATRGDKAAANQLEMDP